MSIHIREKDEKSYLGDLAVGTFFVHEEIVYMVTEYSQRSVPHTAVSEINSCGGETLPSKTRVRTVKLVEAIFE